MSKKIYLTLCLMASLSHASTKEWMDFTIQPKKDFYLYSNGSWIKKNPIPKDYGRWSIFDVLEKKNQDELIQLIQSIPKNKLFASKVIYQQIFQYHQSAMDIKEIEALKIKPLIPFISLIKEYHDPSQLSELLAKLHIIGVHAFFEIVPMNDFHHPKQIIAGIAQDALNLPHRDYYLKNDAHSKKIKENYIEFLKTIFIELNFSKEQALRAAIETFTMEKKLAYLSEPTEYFRQPKNIDHPFSSEKFNQLYPFLDFNQYIVSRKLPKHFIINNCTPVYFQKLESYLSTLSPEAIQNYLLAHLIFQFASNLHHSLYQGYCQLNMNLSGSTRCPKREVQITKELNSYLGFAIGDLYVTTHLKKGSIEKTKEIVEQIKQELKKHLQDSWMSEQTKKHALNKINHMKSRVGFNSFYINYETLAIKPQIYVLNSIALLAFENQRQLLKIGQPVNEAEWEMTPQSINAYYDLSQNQINIPLGILQTPFFDIDASDAQNYGGIGAVIGHEMSHGFDDQGSQFDEKGQYHSWWQKEDWKMYQKKIQCIIQQFSEYPVQGHPKHHLNGKLVSGEAIADLMGLKLAFKAYSNHSLEQSEKSRSFQVFFINYAHIWAANIRDEEALKRSLTDPHPPMNIRVNATTSNMPEFYQVFMIKRSNKTMCSLF